MNSPRCIRAFWNLVFQTQSRKFVDEKHPDSSKIVARSRDLDEASQRLHTFSATRKDRLQVLHMCLQHIVLQWSLL